MVKEEALKIVQLIYFENSFAIYHSLILLHVADLLAYAIYIYRAFVCTNVSMIAQRKLCRGIGTEIIGGNILPRDLLPNVSSF